MHLLEHYGNNKKSKDPTIKSEPECSIQTFNDLDHFDTWHDNQSNDNEFLKTKKTKSTTKKRNGSDSDWGGDNFDAHFNDETKIKKKRIKMKKSKNSANKTETTKLEKFFCDHCDKVFHKKHRIQAHLRTHLGLKVLINI